MDWRKSSDVCSRYIVRWMHYVRKVLRNGKCPTPGFINHKISQFVYYRMWFLVEIQKVEQFWMHRWGKVEYMPEKGEVWYEDNQEKSLQRATEKKKVAER